MFRTKDTKLFEDLASATGRSADELKSLPHLTQVQVYLPNSNSYVVLDDVFVETFDNVDGSKAYKFIVSDSKLSANAPWTTNQGKLVDLFKDSQKEGAAPLSLKLRSLKFEADPSLASKLKGKLDDLTPTELEKAVDLIKSKGVEFNADDYVNLSRTNKLSTVDDYAIYKNTDLYVSTEKFGDIVGKLSTTAKQNSELMDGLNMTKPAICRSMPCTFTLPDGRKVNFDEQGLPEFSPYSLKQDKFDNLTGYDSDFDLADKKFGIDKNYRAENELVWHHHQDGETLLLVPRNVHNPFNGGPVHTGGSAILKLLNDLNI